ncbi:MAG: hypothetical protein IT270_13945, partial [Saprospiraceae bacterium]|nr:hypothetical protein [Saprospiraceae bacterium]
QQHWHDAAATFETVQVPGIAARRILSGGNFRDPQQEQNVIDYYNCQHEMVADDILFFCRTVKQNWPRPIITGAFYGYFFSCFNRQAAGGHLALQRVMQSPDIDYLAGPQAYLPEAELPGEPYRSRSLLLSMRLYGKSNSIFWSTLLAATKAPYSLNFKNLIHFNIGSTITEPNLLTTMPAK